MQLYKLHSFKEVNEVNPILLMFRKFKRSGIFLWNFFSSASCYFQNFFLVPEIFVSTFKYLLLIHLKK